MMKIACLIGSLNRGGTETLLLDLVRQHKGVPFGMICVYRKPGVLRDLFLSSGVPLVHLAPGNMLRIPIYLWKLHRLLRREKVTLVHTHQRIDTVYARLALLMSQVRIVQTIHGYDHTDNLQDKLLTRLSMHLAATNLFVSNTQKDYYRHKYRLDSARCETLYNGIDFTKIPVSPGISLKRELGLEANTGLIGMVGNFVPVRDHMTICRFLALLVKVRTDFKFVFIGTQDPAHPELMDDCVSFCKKNGLSELVIFLGLRNDVPDLLPQLDGFIYATHHDTFGIAVTEAIAAGVPVFVNDNEVMREITDEGSRVTLYRTGDAGDLLGKYLACLEDPAGYKTLAQAGAQWARKKFSIRNHLENLTVIYNRFT